MIEKISKEQINQILNGEYKGLFIKAFGITHYHYKDCSEQELVNTSLENVQVHII